MVEISCHGSISVINKITKTLLKKQIRLAEPGEFTKRALMNDKLSVLEAETINDLVNAETENQRKIAIGNLSGSLDKFVSEVSNKLKKLLADVEAIIDFTEEELPKEIYRRKKTGFSIPHKRFLNYGSMSDKSKYSHPIKDWSIYSFKNYLKYE